mmetsp:Transcript_79447/g.223179  ORF Transcript_79447/g.223179 Transcript_79447/m.223179 type:complete len:245 (+) Transcript_79447:813-1547(+)
MPTATSHLELSTSPLFPVAGTTRLGANVSTVGGSCGGARLGCVAASTDAGADVLLPSTAATDGLAIDVVTFASEGSVVEGVGAGAGNAAATTEAAAARASPMVATNLAEADGFGFSAAALDASVVAPAPAGTTHSKWSLTKCVDPWHSGGLGCQKLRQQAIPCPHHLQKPALSPHGTQQSSPLWCCSSARFGCWGGCQIAPNCGESSLPLLQRLQRNAVTDSRSSTTVAAATTSQRASGGCSRS